MQIIIMAGGLGKRMNSNIPKVLHLINDKPMIYYIIQNALFISYNISIIVGKYKDAIRASIREWFPDREFTYILQPEIDGKSGGTGHAIQSCVPFTESDVLILSGDVPLLSVETLRRLIQRRNQILIAKVLSPFGCGRIIFETNQIKRIVEEKDCNLEEAEIQYINCGVYYLSRETLMLTLPLLKNDNNNKEYYLTDCIGYAIQLGIVVDYYKLPEANNYEIANVNCPDDLAKVAQIMDIFSFL